MKQIVLQDARDGAKIYKSHESRPPGRGVRRNETPRLLRFPKFIVGHALNGNKPAKISEKMNLAKTAGELVAVHRDRGVSRAPDLLTPTWHDGASTLGSIRDHGRGPFANRPGMSKYC